MDRSRPEICELSTRYGAMFIFPQDDPIGVALTQYGEWAQHEINAFAALICEGDTVIDVGANIGTHSLAFARFVGPKGRVVAFEPQQVVADLLRTTLRTNSIDWVDVREAGVGHESGFLTVPEVDYSSHVNVGAIELGDTNTPGGTTVPIERLDDLPAAKCAFVKVDAEGMGHLVLQGMRQFISKHRPTVAFEVNSLEEAVLLVQNWQENRYSKYILRTPAFNTDNFYNNSENRFGSATECTLMFVPQEDRHKLSKVAPPSRIAPVKNFSDIAAELLLRPEGAGRSDLIDPYYQIAFTKLSEQQNKHQQVLLSELQAQDLAIQKTKYLVSRASAHLDHAVPKAFNSLDEAVIDKISEKIWNRLEHLQGDISTENEKGNAAPLDLEDGINAASLNNSNTAKKQSASSHRNRRSTKRIRFLDFSPKFNFLVRHDTVFLLNSGYFDHGYYREQAPGIPQDPARAVQHYLKHGVALGLDPSSDFSTEGYLRLHPDVAEANLNPLLHFAKNGDHEGRITLSSGDYRRIHGLGLSAALVDLKGALQTPKTEFDCIEQSELFDDEYYSEQRAEDFHDRRSAAIHYFLVGWRDGNDPSANFSTRGYLLLNPAVNDIGGCPLLYYECADKNAPPLVLTVSEYEAIRHLETVSESLIREARVVLGAKEFDPDYYASEAQLSDDCRPLYLAIHYLQTGSRQLLDPSASFSTKAYFELNPVLAMAGDVDALLHYVLFGKKEDRPHFTVEQYRQTLEKRLKPTLPNDKQWKTLKPSGGIAADNPICDVVVPVYKGMSETMACLYSVVRHPQKTPFRLIVVNDCSPEPELAEALRDLSTSGFFELVEQSENMGFVRSVNAGMARNADRDIVLLNSDAEVFGNWLDRFYEAAAIDENIATITPFSNNATICSYPLIAEDFDRGFERPDAEIDELAALVNHGSVVDLPTGHGFCMFIRRAALSEVGVFDEERFGRGYGEENDFCRRAIAHGWRNVLAPNIFVRHYGSVSFGFDKFAQIKRSQEILSDLYPAYDREIADFCRTDATYRYRRNLDLARLKRHASAEAMLLVSHQWGGGTERHVLGLGGALSASGTPVFVCREVGGIKTKTIGLGLLHEAPFPNAPVYQLDRDPDEFLSALSELGINRIHLHQLVGMDPAAIEFFAKVFKRGATENFITIHDYYAICPRINLVDKTDTYCGEPDLKQCEGCASEVLLPFGYSVRRLRQEFEDLILASTATFVPNQDVALRLSRYFPDAEFTVKPHAVYLGDANSTLPETPKAPENGPRHIVTIGMIGKAKGSEVILAAAKHAHEHSLPLKFTIMGYTDIDEAFEKLPNVTITGKYEEAQGLSILQDLEPTLLWFPSIWPETFSYTLSYAFQTGVFPVVFDIGAPANRLKKANWGGVWPLGRMFSPSSICDGLLTQPIEPMTTRTLEEERIVQTYEDPLARYYGTNA